jgi:chaperone protein EcpD
MNTVTRVLGVVLAVLCFAVPTAQAGVVITGTRVIFSAQQGEVTVRLSNKGNKPALVEAWADDGNPQSTPDNTHAPFLITPPLFRMEPNKDQSLRILYLQGKQPLPSDRESLFWLNVLEVPPKPTGPQLAGKNYLQFAFRSRLKLFYRPAKLAGDPLKAPDQLAFRASAAGQHVTLVAHNPTPYYITVVSLSLGTNAPSVLAEPGMVAPFGDVRLELKNITHNPAPGIPVSFTTINDYGADDVHHGTVTQ